jgi:hypothetical protein
MTSDERLLGIADAEMDIYGEIRSAEAKEAYDHREAQRGTRQAPNAAAADAAQTASMPEPTRLPAVQPAVPAYLRAVDPKLSRDERTLAKGEAAADPEQWRKYLATFEDQADREIAVMKAQMIAGNPRSADIRATRPQMQAPARVPAIVPSALAGDGLFVVGLDIEPGVYRTAGPARSGRAGMCLLLKSTSNRDIANLVRVAGPATITIGPNIKAVEVSGCQPWQRLGDNLDAVLQAKRGDKHS